MAEKIIFSIVDEKGREFKITGDLEEIRRKIEELHTSEEDDEDYIVYFNGEERPSTSDDRFLELVQVSAYFDEEFDWLPIFNEIPKKKNGTFYKNRIKVLHRANSFSHLYEEGYGYIAPEVRIKIIGDLEAEVQFGNFVLQW